MAETPRRAQDLKFTNAVARARNAVTSAKGAVAKKAAAVKLHTATRALEAHRNSDDFKAEQKRMNIEAGARRAVESGIDDANKDAKRKK